MAERRKSEKTLEDGYFPSEGDALSEIVIKAFNELGSDVSAETLAEELAKSETYEKIKLEKLARIKRFFSKPSNVTETTDSNAGLVERFGKDRKGNGGYTFSVVRRAGEVYSFRLNPPAKDELKPEVKAEVAEFFELTVPATTVRDFVALKLPSGTKLTKPEKDAIAVEASLVEEFSEGNYAALLFAFNPDRRKESFTLLNSILKDKGILGVKPYDEKERETIEAAKDKKAILRGFLRS